MAELLQIPLPSCSAKTDREYDQAILNEQNGWRYTWYGLNSRYSWTVEEVEVPEGFTMSLRRHGHKFTIVNDDTPVMPGTPDNLRSQVDRTPQIHQIHQIFQVHPSLQTCQIFQVHPTRLGSRKLSGSLEPRDSL